MLFYTCEIPKAFIDLDKMKDIVMDRYNCYSRGDSNCDNSTDYDVLGHFIMCLIANKSSLLHDVIVKGETRIFSKKLHKMKSSVIQKDIACALNFLNYIHQIDIISSPSDKLRKNKNIIENIFKIIILKACHVFHKKHKKDCHKLEMQLPFTFAVSLVAERKVQLAQGKARVMCGQWNIILEKVFKCFLEFEIHFFNQFRLLQHFIYEVEDDRLRNLIENCMTKMSGELSCLKNVVSADMVDENCQYFPPCMSNLHQILRQTHRLSYDSRYQYTLFLRDIGLPVKQNVLFWKNEYTKPNVASNCTHSWGEKRSRYEYQIYHLYGLNGSRTTKTSHPCQKFIGKLTLRMNGGCPFAHLSRDDLRNSLPRELPERDIEDILSYKAENRPQRACAAYLNSQRNYLQNDFFEKKTIFEILSPLHYYYLAREVDKT